MSKVGLFFGTQTGNTEDIAMRIQDRLGKDNVSVHDISEADTSDFAEYECIIIGCPTWNVGEMQADWEGVYEDLDDIDFSGKKVAYFGPGDQIGYADNFMDAIGILEEKISSLGGQTVGYWPAEGYDFNESRALRNGKFVGLAIDEDNQSDLSDDRIAKWTTKLKSEFGL
ncbi:flavodoxin, long chain [Rubidibacter lacunae KORDI 51-2]|uniref:Flavodoxin n=1 Tax=Rubidibacter lacunae KORDI 51-2 TaxID=582515 RepID=U5DCQ1_9CHRO|nr:flavodoxin FldA [Rubidibacter lacunae]ERN42303.1 flavodoxin, long chain [Rubidibacter lacunae KORDI 51-2]